MADGKKLLPYLEVLYLGLHRLYLVDLYWGERQLSL